METLTNEDRQSIISSILPSKDTNGNITRNNIEISMPFSLDWPALKKDDRTDNFLFNAIMMQLLSNDSDLKAKIDDLVLKTDMMYKMIVTGSIESGWEFTECHCGDMEAYSDEDINNLF